MHNIINLKGIVRGDGGFTEGMPFVIFFHQGDAIPPPPQHPPSIRALQLFIQCHSIYLMLELYIHCLISTFFRIYFLNVHSKNLNMLDDFLVKFSKKKKNFSATYLTRELGKMAALFLPRRHSGASTCWMISVLAGFVFISLVNILHSECWLDLKITIRLMFL